MMRKLTIPLSENSSKNSFLSRKPYLFSIFKILALFVLIFSINTSLFGQCSVTPVGGSTVTVCEGTPLSLSILGTGSGSVAGASLLYSWSTTSSNGFSSTTEDPQVTTTSALADAGTYTVTLTDDQGTPGNASDDCTATTSIMVTVNPLPTAAVTTLDICDTNTDGFEPFTLTDADATVLGTQVAANHTITYHVSQADADGDANPLASPYTNTTVNSQIIYARVEVTATGCYATSAVTLMVNPLPTAAVTTLDICDTNTDGFEPFTLTDADAMVLGTQVAANHTITYHVSQADADADGDANPLASPYTNTAVNSQVIYARVEVTATGCYATSEVTLTVNPLPTATAAVLEECDDNTDGIVAFTLTDADAMVLGGQIAADHTVTYFVSQAAADANASGTALASPYTNTTANSQTVYARVEVTATGCYSTSAVTLTVNSLPIATITPSATTLCPTEIITLTASGNNTNTTYTYVWNINPTTQSINVSNAGVYSVTITDTATGCTDTASETITSASTTTPTVEDDHICPGTNTGTLSVAGAASGSTYLWSGPNNFSATTATISNLFAGTYSVTVSGSGCDEVAMGMVVQTPDVAATLQDVQICTGTMTTLDAGPGNTWSWNTGATTRTITVGQGTYNVTVTANVGSSTCPGFGSATVTETSSPNIAISSTANVICSNPSGATITLSVSGSSFYTWSGPGIVGTNIGNSITINSAGTYTVSDNSTCVGSGSINIADGTPITILGVDANNMTICSGATATFTLGGGGNGAMHQLYINNAAVGMPTATPSWTSSTLANGDMVYVETTNAFGCIGNSDTITMQVDQFDPILVASPSNTVCAGTTVTYLANGGGNGGTYEFFINGVSQGVQSSNFFSPNTVNNGDVIRVNVSNTNGCSGFANPDPMTMTVNPALVVNLTASGNSNCSGEAATFTATNNSGQTGVTYQFYVNDVLQSSSGSTFTSSSLANGDILYVTATTTGSASCTAQSNSITISSSTVTANLTTSNGSSTFCSGEIVTFFASGGSSYEFFINEVSQGVSGISSLTTNSLVTGTNNVSVTVSSSAGCSDSDALTINVTAAPTITISTPPSNICAGSPVTFTASGASQFEFFINGLVAQATSTSGSFTTTALANGDVVSVTGYTSGMCSPNVVYNQVTVTNNTSAGTISGGNAICQGSTVQLSSSSTITSGTWLSSNNSVATVNSSGLVTGNSPGTVNITYTVVSGGCSSNSQPYAVFVSQTGTISITSSDSDNIICEGDPFTLTASGGTGSSYTWTDNLGTTLPSTATITVNPAANVTSYTVTASGGSCAGTQTLPITVNANPVAGAITGNTAGGANICQGTSMALNASASGGVITWSSSNPSIVSVNSSTGMITTTNNISLLPASAVITFTVSNNGCTATSPAFAVNVMDCSAATVGGVKVSPKILLEGPYNTATQLMNDDLRQLPTSLASPFPLTEPYSNIVDANNANLFVHSGNGGGETTTAAVLATTGPNAIVDWVFLELRSGANSSMVMSTVSALLQRDGDIVGVDGVSPVCLAGANGSYYLAVRHRNHVGIMTANPVALSSSSTTVIDMSTPITTTAGYMSINGTHPVDTINNRLVLYGGDANSDGRTIFSGPDNDRDYVFFEILTDTNNTNSSFNHIRAGYYQGDTNLDGEVKYQGPTNDLDRLMFFNVIFYPGTAGIVNGIIVQQIP